MYQKKLYFIYIIILLAPQFLSAQVKSDQVLNSISFGSCNRQDKPQPLWKDIQAEKSDLWIWLGDNVYGDTEDMKVLKAKYDLQNQQSDYKALVNETPIIGTWDDHDFGVNDGGKEFPKRKESQQLLQDFLNIPADSKLRKREGVYASYTYGQPGSQVKIILLDARYFRDPIKKGENGYIKNEEGELLGEAQWKWLKKELKSSQADIHIIGSGIQFIPEEHRFEKWANFPKERNRLFDLFSQLNPKNVILLSGDRHIAEISKLEFGAAAAPVYEVTSSGLTHSYEAVGEEPNRHRISKLIGQKNYGIIQIDWEQKYLKLFIKGKGGQIYAEEKVSF